MEEERLGRWEGRAHAESQVFCIIIVMIIKGKHRNGLSHRTQRSAWVSIALPLPDAEPSCAPSCALSF